MKNARTAGPELELALLALGIGFVLGLVLAPVLVACALVQAITSASRAMLRAMTAALDGTKPVRKGEELDLAALAKFLDVPAEKIEITQFPGGHSNLTYLVRIAEKELVLRRPPFGNTVKTAHDMGREVRMLTRLAPFYDKAPKVIAHTDDASILGAPFYLMERVRGVVIRRALPDGANARTISELVIDGLAELHAIDVAKNGLLDLGKPDGFVERQVRGWSERYVAAQTDDIADMPALSKWLGENMPKSPPPTIVHNDWKHDNFVLTPELDRIVGVLDWEMSTIGDPLVDLGTTLAYWVENGDDELLKGVAFCPTTAAGSFTRTEAVARYAEKSGRDSSNVLFYYVFALFKNAVVAQQIYARWKKGLTKDERFGTFIWGVRALAAQAQHALAKGDISS
jgi:aminoglycoside phosphotransferase (APT) family kinase protein